MKDGTGTMKRSVLVSVMVLGAVVTLVMGAGTFAVFTDRATTDQNSAQSKELPRAADLKLAFGVTGPSACATATYVDTHAMPAMSISDAEPGTQVSRWYCLKNAGSAALDVTSTVIDVVNVEIDCTGDEGAPGIDATCVSGEEGELGSVLVFYPRQVNCDLSPGGISGYGGFLSSPEPPVSLGTLAPGAILCGSIEVFYPLNRSTEDELRAQSDTVTWRFAFDGTTAP